MKTDEKISSLLAFINSEQSDPSHYSEVVHNCAIYPKDVPAYVFYGLIEEVGEIAGKVKRVIREHEGSWNDKLRAELRDEFGDYLWYLNEFLIMTNCVYALSLLKQDYRHARDNDKLIDLALCTSKRAGLYLDERDQVRPFEEAGSLLEVFHAAMVEYGFDFEEIAKANCRKLMGRLERGTLRGSGDHR